MGLGPPICTKCKKVCVLNITRWYCAQCDGPGDSHFLELTTEEQIEYDPRLVKIFDTDDNKF